MKLKLMAVTSQCIGAAVFVLLATMVARDGRLSIVREDHSPASMSQDVDIVNIVAVTEDNALGGDRDGGDSISLHDVTTGRMLDAGTKHISPGRIAGTKDLSFVAANPSNGCGYRSGNPSGELNVRCDSWLALRRPRSSTFTSVEDGYYIGGRIATKAGIAFNRNGDLVIATGAGPFNGASVIPPRPPFGVSLLRLPARLSSEGRLPQPESSIKTESLIAEILPTSGGDLLLLVSLSGLIQEVDASTLAPTGSSAWYPTPVARYSSVTETAPPIQLFHASHSSMLDVIAVGGMERRDVNVVSMSTGQTASLTLSDSVPFVGGVAYNNGWVNSGLLAVHALDRVLVLQHLAMDRLRIVSEMAIDPPNRLADPLDIGPALSIAWSTDGRYIIAASDVGVAEFVVLKVSPTDYSMAVHSSITASRSQPNFANDVWTANGLITATPGATTPATPSPTRTATPTASATRRPPSTPTIPATMTPIPSATQTLVPAPIYLPIALTESCDPTQVRIDVALVIDASSSMREPAGPGRAATKLDAALQAVGSFLDILALDAGDQAAIVSFSSDAWLHTGLSADRAALDAALAEVTPGQQTRLDRGIEVGTTALMDDATRVPANEPLLIVLTDGRANPVPVDVAVERAADAKAEGITIFSIGLGEDLEVEALRQIASEPAFYLHAPTAGELAGVYAEVARSIPCPPSAYWRGR